MSTVPAPLSSRVTVVAVSTVSVRASNLVSDLRMTPSMSSMLLGSLPTTFSLSNPEAEGFAGMTGDEGSAGEVTMGVPGCGLVTNRVAGMSRKAAEGCAIVWVLAGVLSIATGMSRG